MKIGLIGLGIMGKPMAKNLLKAGYDLTVSDLNQASVDEIVAAGAKAATNAEIGETCDVVLTMVPNSPQVKAVMLGEDGVAAHMKPGSVFIDMSSINPVASKEIAAELAKRGIEMLDAPVSLGTGGTLDGVHRVPLIFGCDLTAIGADNTGKTPRHCTLTSKSPDCSSAAARMGS